MSGILLKNHKCQETDEVKSETYASGSNCFSDESVTLRKEKKKRFENGRQLF